MEPDVLARALPLQVREVAKVQIGHVGAIHELVLQIIQLLRGVDRDVRHRGDFALRPLFR